MQCERCGRSLNAHCHRFEGISLCEDCLVSVNGIYRGLRGHLHKLERAGTALIGASLRAGEPLTATSLIEKLQQEGI